MTSAWTMEALPGTWAELRTQVTGDRARPVQWIWCGQDGVVRCPPAELPHQAPIATHCWGWGDGEWYRVRIDGEHVVGARLATHDGDAEVAGSAVQVRQVQTRGRSVRESSMLDDGDAAQSLRGQPMTAYRVLGRHPLTFVEIHDETQSAVR